MTLTGSLWPVGRSSAEGDVAHVALVQGATLNQNLENPRLRDGLRKIARANDMYSDTEGDRSSMRIFNIGLIAIALLNRSAMAKCLPDPSFSYEQ
jgi:hypothetical protein